MTDLTALDATALSALLAAGKTSAVELMTATLDRIDAVNPKINAIVSLRDRATLLAEAAAADAAPRKGWLHGLPVAVKDLQAVAGIRSTWGSPLFADFVPEADALLPAKLRAAGAILIGKTNTPEFGLGSHSFNPVHGATGSPYDPSRTAGGSSGGAASALAARLVAVADGSDMMGSLRNPAAFCNVYGFRPSYGLVPSDPVGDTFLHQLSTDGPMARTVEDLARLLETLAGYDPRLPHSLPPEPYAEGLDSAPAGLRIGWLGDWGGAWAMEPGILELCEDALKVFERLGCAVEPVAPPFPAEKLWQSWTTLRSWAVAARLGLHHADPKRRARLKPEAIWEIERGLALSAMEVHRASVIRSEWFVKLAELFTRYDALVLPTAQVWPFPKGWRYPEQIAGQPMDSYHRWMEAVVPVSLVGLPALAAPAGFGASGLPMGFQLFGPRGADRRILQLGQAYHRATEWPQKRPPAM
ncbi:amidase [Acidimangrovimonas pyrenivorans]|uniref:Amidase n=1 Tax=Acidimangrovimonas pyrenivorans TaxID=2030798 RepID=A0ABV7AIE3_9RHOB